jgi:hypothetical protein
MRKTKPNLGRLGCLGKGRRVGRGAAGERNVQNEPNFGPACSVPVRALGSASILRAAGPRAGWACCEETPHGVTTNGARVQNEPNWARAPGNGRWLAGPRCPPDGDCAKRSQFGGRIVRNEPNLVRPGAADGRNCAKQSQTWEDWDIWAKRALWGRGSAGSEMCKTNPISKRQVSSLRFQGADRKEHVPDPLTSNFKPQTSHSLACKTKPMTDGFLVAAGTLSIRVFCGSDEHGYASVAMAPGGLAYRVSLIAYHCRPARAGG